MTKILISPSMSYQLMFIKVMTRVKNCVALFITVYLCVRSEQLLYKLILFCGISLYKLL